MHPQPHPGEALTSWLGRLADIYGLSVRQLLRHNLGTASALLDDAAAGDLDWDPPLALLAALAERTGTEPGDLRLMTVGGWVPWLADTLDAGRGPEAFRTYARQTRSCSARARPAPTPSGDGCHGFQRNA